MTEVLIAPTGTANLASVLAAFKRLGAAPRVSDDADEIHDASHVMLPGVGAFAAAMEQLKAKDLDAALKRRIEADKPTICICVGHQLLFATSDESPGTRGLAVLEGHIGRFSTDVRVPQFGWNMVTAPDTAQVHGSGYAYFANSYRAESAPGCEFAHAEHGGAFVAALERSNLIGCQFHPELSGSYGEALLSRFLELR